MKYISWSKDKLEELVKLWNKELGSYFPMRKELFEQNSFNDENVCFEASRIAIDENDNVIGFLVAKRWQEELEVGMNLEIGWIQVLLVDQRFRNKRVGTNLLKHAEETLMKNGIKSIVLGRDPWHYFPGVPQPYNDVSRWFEKQGYNKIGSDYDVICNYDSESDTDFPRFEEVEFSVLNLKDKDAFLQFFSKCFPGRWEYEAIQYFEKGGTGREFVVLKKSEKIIGFCRMNDSNSPIIAQNVYWAPLINKELGGIGPLGIDSNERKNGYGLAIVQAGIAYLRNRNVSSIVIDWTGLIDFYGKLGYEVWKSYDSYKKII
ncbi:GNAT family N-acetyltransferase [Bacillus salacetis]|uniref:GNAT family N-acetyltransferase n=1 Tax=Bacillus salacetis TaxID=2315464 RepID=A0A3A1R0D8_9BACI|nr:GNAT family N-acetyltransferase [Bacillus salacetis]RIW34228.1 GNAT family N-acetyltransferase [Bacillus salacetis]